MHNIKEIRKNTELFEKKIKERNSTVDFKSIVEFLSLIFFSNSSMFFLISFKLCIVFFFY